MLVYVHVKHLVDVVTWGLRITRVHGGGRYQSHTGFIVTRVPVGSQLNLWWRQAIVWDGLVARLKAMLVQGWSPIPGWAKKDLNTLNTLSRGKWQTVKTYWLFKLTHEPLQLSSAPKSARTQISESWLCPCTAFINGKKKNYLKTQTTEKERNYQIIKLLYYEP